MQKDGAGNGNHQSDDHPQQAGEQGRRPGIQEDEYFQMQQIDHIRVMAGAGKEDSRGSEIGHGSVDEPTLLDKRQAGGQKNTDQAE